MKHYIGIDIGGTKTAILLINGDGKVLERTQTVTEVGSMGVRLGDLLFDPARKEIEKEAVPGAAAACRIVPAALGEAIGDYAALCVALSDYK